jgi:hypothetical protein
MSAEQKSTGLSAEEMLGPCVFGGVLVLAVIGWFLGIPDLPKLVLDAAMTDDWDSVWNPVRHALIVRLIAVASMGVIVGTLYVIGRKIYVRQRDKKYAEQELRSAKFRIQELMTRAWKDLLANKTEIAAISNDIRGLQNWSNYFFRAEARTMVLQFEQEYARLVKASENAKQREEQKQEKERAEFRKKVTQVYEVFKKQGHAETIPERFKDYDMYVIETAKEWLEEDRQREKARERQEEKDQESWREAVLYVWKHRALPSDFADLPDDKKRDYLEALRYKKEGMLEEQVEHFRNKDEEQRRKEYLTDDDYIQLAGSVEAGKAREKELLENNFYPASELTPEEKRFLLKFHGFKEFDASNFGDGFIPVIYHGAERNESPAHFCSKYLFARLHPDAEVEARDYLGNEIDVLFRKGKQKIAVEIERGTNKAGYVGQKVSDLSQAYAKVLLVVPRKVLPTYRMYHNGKKVFVFTPKKAKEAVLRWLK